MSRSKFLILAFLILTLGIGFSVGLFAIVVNAFPMPSGETEKAVVYFESIEDLYEEEKEVFHVEQKEITTEDKTSKIQTFELTAYCPCEICCGEYAKNRPTDENGKPIVYGSTGERLTSGYSIAVDPNVIPYGSEVIIDGKVYKAQDCGGVIKANRIDVYFENHQECLNFGRQTKEVEIVEK